MLKKLIKVKIKVVVVVACVFLFVEEKGCINVAVLNLG